MNKSNDRFPEKQWYFESDLKSVFFENNIFYIINQLIKKFIAAGKRIKYAGKGD